jgi:isocitrate/isopropylmalate dehydrogenase
MNKVALLPGDGIGPEIIDEAVKVLMAVSNLNLWKAWWAVPLWMPAAFPSVKRCWSFA